MKHVSSCLRQHYPNTYEQFLRSMFDLNEDKISASQCLVQIRLSLCEFPLLVDKFEQLYNTLVNFSSTARTMILIKKEKEMLLIVHKKITLKVTRIAQLLTNKHGSGRDYTAMRRLIKRIQMDQAY